jgi:hypothetical protein
MRIAYTLLVVLILASCSKSDAVISGNPATQDLRPSGSETEVINATITSDFTYELPLSTTNIQIHKQAAHFTLSEIGVDAKKGTPVYQYLPAKGFTGTDEVTLKDVETYESNSHDGGDCHNMDDGQQRAIKTSFIKIKFTVN